MALEAKAPVVPIGVAAKLAGLSEHMLVYLHRMDILSPSGNGAAQRGRRRLYTFSDVIFLQVIASLLAKGIEVKRLQIALRRAREDAATWIDIRKEPRRYLVTDGIELYVRQHGKLESKNFNRQFAFAFVLDLKPAHKLLSAAWPKDAAKGPPHRRVSNRGRN